MRKSARVTVTLVAAVALAGCGRRRVDPCEAATFNEQACQDAVRAGGYYWGGTWYPMQYYRPYPFYYDRYHTYVSSGGAVTARAGRVPIASLRPGCGGFGRPRRLRSERRGPRRAGRRMMRRIRNVRPAPAGSRRWNKWGSTWHSGDRLYWNESAFYEFTAKEVDVLEAATNELEAMTLAAAQHVIDNRLYSRMGIPEIAVPLIERSWEAEPPSLYGRFDLAYDGSGPPKLLEYNADTPTSLLEAAVVQWYWLQDYVSQAGPVQLHSRAAHRAMEGADALSSRPPTSISAPWTTPRTA